ncbi:hypothetical protein [Fulvimonas yonginensis]|uniref:Oligosaccharide repeat unit polymerase n=1 Tax=Fulvimonas yonginensis TaxID=1495200 RepID=A0ABU8JAV1_9GAMM
MNALRLPSTYLAWPLLFACGLAWLTYDLPPGYGEGIALLAGCAVALLALDRLPGSARLPEFGRFRRHYAGTRDAFVATAFALAVLGFCLLDLALFPVTLVDDPSAYATMAGGREHIRHISDMCWTLPAIGLLCVRKRWLRWLLVGTGLVFPVLVVDRNRLCAGLFAIALVLVLRRDEERPLPWKRIALIALAGASVFSLIGLLRSGPLTGVTLPFRTLYTAAPQGIKWLLLYITAGPYNFGAIEARQYHDASFLIHQVVPMSGSVATAGTGIPLDSPTVNVGTEFFPFLLAWGPWGAVASVFALYAWLCWSVRRLRPSASLFGLLIFLRMAYVCVMAPFAPQAFIWTNVDFIVLCLLMQLAAAWLPDRTARAPGQGAPSTSAT